MKAVSYTCFYLRKITIQEILTVLMLLTPFSGLTQEKKDNVNGEEDDNVKIIEIINADILLGDRDKYGPDINVLKGNVRFFHDGAFMDCDSAYFNSNKNEMMAFSNIHINRGDTLHLYGDSLHYMGKTKMAEVRRNVKLHDMKTTLNTHYLDFDMAENIGYYKNGGKIVDSANTLVSESGHYYSDTKEFIFTDSVVLTNPDYVMYSDSLTYNSSTEISYFYGPTEIVSDTNYIYCENGWYDTQNDISEFEENAYLVHKYQILKGDSLYYERYHKGRSGMGQAFGNVSMIDTVENIFIYGDYGIYFEEPERAMVTDSALFLQVEEADTLYLHGDTLQSTMDTSGAHKILKAYYKVKMYRFDIQSKCDSLVYSFQDSVIRMYYDPVVWSEENQMTAEYIYLYTKNNEVDYVELIDAGYVISEKDTIRYNQMKGTKITGYFKDSELKKVVVKGNAQSLYFPVEEEEPGREKLIGVNKAESTNITMYMEDGEPERIIFQNQPVGTMYPPEYLTPVQLKMSGFHWLSKHRPMNKEDVFTWITDTISVSTTEDTAKVKVFDFRNTKKEEPEKIKTENNSEENDAGDEIPQDAKKEETAGEIEKEIE